MRLSADHVKVSVPATAGNLGPGFDALGMALGVADEVEVRALASSEVTIEIEGEGESTLARDESHLVVQALRAALDHVGASQTGLHIRAINRIPHGRGLGSSAAAVVAGIVAARALIAEPDALSLEESLVLANAFEGHPDNAAPAIYGGATVAWKDTEGVHARPLQLADEIETAVLIPSSVLPTKEARAPCRRQWREVPAAACCIGTNCVGSQAAMIAAAERSAKVKQGARPTSWRLQAARAPPARLMALKACW